MTPEDVDPESSMFDRLDPLALGPAVARMGAGLAAHPSKVLEAGTRFAGRLLGAAATTTARALGGTPEPAVTPEPKDRRFADPAWREYPAFLAGHQVYLAWSELVEALPGLASLNENDRAKAGYAVGLLVDALSPTNFLATNPVALRTALETKGVSVLKGLRNFADDVAHNGGYPRQVDTSAFRVGQNLAATPGKVVLRNDLMELLQYEPQTATVHATPLLVSPPWINKYYLLDLAPGRSFIEWAVTHGHTTFAISYRNPDASMRDVRLDDYLLKGPLAALDAVADITGAPTANIAALCIGGTLTVMLLAYLAAHQQDRVNAVTLLNTLVDFSEPGPLGCFTSPEAIARLERRMAAKGFLESRDMATSFNTLRANDLIWNYVATNWLMGQPPPAFDILAWNGDATRMPAAMHSFYLRSCYLENELARGTLELAGTTLDPRKVTADTYIVGAVEDHIVPWRAAYATTQLLSGEKRYVLTSSGHIAGVVNPPGQGKRQYWTNDELPEDPERWRAGATLHPGSWWEDWAPWMAKRAGRRHKPPPMGSTSYPPIADAPGDYVHG